MTNTQPFKTEALGKIVQNEVNPLVMSPNGRRLVAYIDERFKDFVNDSSYLVAECSDLDLRILCRVRKIESYPKQAMIVFSKQHEFVTKAELEPIGQLGNGGVGNLPNANFNGYDIRRVCTDELIALYGIPKVGLPCGDLVADNDSTTVPYRLPDELLYRSLFICGAKGSGKTSCLRYVLPHFVGTTGRMNQPCIVILDVEGEFSTPEVRALFAGVGASVNLQRISTDVHISTATLGFSQVHYEHLIYFAPNLPLNSILALESIYKQLVYQYSQKGVTRKAEEVLNDIREAAWRQPGIHTSQREAIIRATMSDVFSLFDQMNLSPLLATELVRPGYVSIIDTSTLTDDQQRTVALYLLSVFAGFKNQTQDSTGLLLIMDEAQKLFPHKGDLKQDYARRLAKFVNHIVHRGRRRRYGIVLSTQYPADVSKEVVELCDTKFVFKMSGPLEWLRCTLGGLDFARSASSLRVGEAYLVSNGLITREPIKVRFPWISPIESIEPAAESSIDLSDHGSNGIHEGTAPSNRA